MASRQLWGQWGLSGLKREGFELQTPLKLTAGLREGSSADSSPYMYGVEHVTTESQASAAPALLFFAWFAQCLGGQAFNVGSVWDIRLLAVWAMPLVMDGPVPPALA